MINKNALIHALKVYTKMLEECDDNEFEDLIDRFPNPYDYSIVFDDDKEYLRWHQEMAIANGCCTEKQATLSKLRSLSKQLNKMVNELNDEVEEQP